MEARYARLDSLAGSLSWRNRTCCAWLLEKTVRNNILKLVPVLLLSLAGTLVSASGVPVNAESKTGYAPIHGMQLYYEIHGQGKPMILLHGGITAFEGFGSNIDDLAKSR